MEEQALYRLKCIRIGIITLGVGMIANFIPAVYFFFAYGVMPPLADLFKIWTVAAITFGISWFIQPVTFFSMLGVSGTYIGWLAGNCADICAPAVTMAQKAAGYEAGTPEGDVMATIGITGSIFVSVTIIFLATFIGGNMLDALPAFVKAGFKYILPAVFGAVYVQLCLKHLKVGIITIAAGLAIAFIFHLLHVPGYILNIVLIAMGILFSRMEYLHGRKSNG